MLVLGRRGVSSGQGSHPGRCLSCSRRHHQNCLGARGRHDTSRASSSLHFDANLINRSRRQLAMVSCPKMLNLLVKLKMLVSHSLDPLQKSLMDLEIRRRPGHLVCIVDRSDSTPFSLMAMIAAMQCGVPVVPGTPGPVGSYKDGEAFITEYGFPSKSWDIGSIFRTCLILGCSHYQGCHGRWWSRYASRT